MRGTMSLLFLQRKCLSFMAVPWLIFSSKCLDSWPSNTLKSKMNSPVAVNGRDVVRAYNVADVSRLGTQQYRTRYHNRAMIR